MPCIHEITFNAYTDIFYCFFSCIKLESHPSCSTNASSADYKGRIGDILRLNCTVGYTGNWSPYMVWSRNDGINITAMSKVIQNNTSITSTLTLSMNSDDNGVTFTCKTAFTHSTEIETKLQARKMPKYQFVWNFTADVLCEYSLFNYSAQTYRTTTLSRSIDTYCEHENCRTNLSYASLLTVLLKFSRLKSHTMHVHMHYITGLGNVPLLPSDIFHRTLPQLIASKHK